MKADWFAYESIFRWKMHQRSVDTYDGSSPFLYFDGPTMQHYSYPPRASEIYFCDKTEITQGCNTGGRGFDTDRMNLPISSLDVKASIIGENAGRGVFAGIDIPELSYVGLDKIVHTVYMPAYTYSLIAVWQNEAHWAHSYYRSNAIEMYSHGYGHSFTSYVSASMEI